MITALTVWENRISPVFDSSRTLLVAEIEDKKISNRHYEPFNPCLPSHFADRLNALGVEVLICGAISQHPADIIEAIGIKLLAFITGNTDELLENLVKNKSIVPAFLMPGCRNRNHMKNCKGKKIIPRQSKKGGGSNAAKRWNRAERSGQGKRTGEM